MAAPFSVFPTRGRKHGVYQMGDFPFEFAVISLVETPMHPTTMMFRNLPSMDVEGSIRLNRKTLHRKLVTFGFDDLGAEDTSVDG